MRRVLADTGPLYALATPRDAHHQRASGEVEALESGGWRIAVVYPTLLEAHALILRRVGPELALRWLDEVRHGVDLVAATPQDHAAACELISRYPDQAITLFDAVTAVVARDLEVPVWTYDHHFDVLGISVWR